MKFISPISSLPILIIYYHVRRTKTSAIIREGELEKAYGKKKPRILSGMRPTGKLHIGHFAGALEPWVKLQNIAENFHLIADYHVLTTKLDTSDITQLSVDMAMDWIAFGIDPEKSPIFRQSKVKEHAELFLIFSMLITKARLRAQPCSQRTSSRSRHRRRNDVRASRLSCIAGSGYFII